jgi:hypothetical protein
MIEETGGIDGELYAPDAVSYRPWDLVAQTLATSKDPRQAERAGEFDAEFTVGRMYSDAKVTIEEAEEDGDEVRLRWRLRGVHAYAFNGVEASGEPVDATGYTTYRFADGRIVEAWGAVDCSSLGAICSQTVEALARARTIQGVCLVRPEERIQPRS